MRTFLCAVLLFAATAAAQDYEGHAVVRVDIQSMRDLRLMLSLSDDPWSHGVGIGKVDFRVSPQALEALDRSGVKYDVLIKDVQGLIDAEKVRLEQGGVAGDEWFADFKNYAQVNARMNVLASKKPGLAQVFELGTSIEQRPIRGLKISTGGNHPAVLFNGCQHAREWVSVMVPMYIAEHLVEGYGVDPHITELLGTLDVYIVPIVNPDGYVYSWDVDRLWRKNRRPNAGGSFGVDNNRNWGFMWGGEGSSDNPADDTYHGTGPFSEPETVALRDVFVDHPEIVSFIDFHSYGQWVLYPWGWTVDLSADAPTFEAIANNLEAVIADVHGFPYVGGPIYTLLYPASRGSLDWCYGEQGIWALSIELRDKGEFGFILPPNQIIPTCEENWAAVIHLMDTVADAVFFYFPDGRPSHLEAGDSTELALGVAGIQDVDLLTDSIAVWARVGTLGTFEQLKLDPVEDGTFVATLPDAPCGALVQYYVEAVTTRGVIYREPANAPDELFEARVVTTVTTLNDEFEVESGWSAGAPGDTATGGKWIRVNPNGTIAQPEDDHTPDGAMCFVTGQGPVGGGAGAADVDGGITTLTSPIFDGTMPGARLAYWRWYSNNQGSVPKQDSMPIEISNNAGATWSPVELVTENADAWVERTFTIEDLIEPTSSMRIRFVAGDLGLGSLVEAGLDDLRIFTLLCEDGILADISQDGVIDGCDLGLMLCDWGSCGKEGMGCFTDLNGDGNVDGEDLGILLSNWSKK